MERIQTTCVCAIVEFKRPKYILGNVLMACEIIAKSHNRVPRKDIPTWTVQHVAEGNEKLSREQSQLPCHVIAVCTQYMKSSLNIF